MTARVLALIALELLMGTARACRFAQDAQPAQWYEWADSLFAADVTSVDADAGQCGDAIHSRVVAPYKGPAGAATASVPIPTRRGIGCRLERPAVGARVLVALNPNSDT